MNVEVLTLEKLKEILRGRVLLFCHTNADPDSICAAFGVGELVRVMDPQADTGIVLPGGPSSLSKRVMEKLGIKAIEDPSVDDVDVLVALDTATLEHLEEWGDVIASADLPKVFIDHHSPHESISEIATLIISDETASSTCEIVHQLYQGFRNTPSSLVAKALLVGMAFDSRHFSLGTSRTLRSASQLLEIDGPLDEVLSLLVSEWDRSERIARLKAAKRLRIHEVDNWIIVTSYLSSFQASAARAIIGLGADVAIVASKDKKTLRASLRANERFYKETSIHLGADVAKVLGGEFEGAGSGHPTAAGMNGKGETVKLLSRSVEIITKKLDRKLLENG